MIFASKIDTPIGSLFIYADEKYITEITFAEKDISALTSNAIVDNAIDQLSKYFIGDLQQFDLPLAQKGTDFQQGVWQNLVYIPYGETISYAKFSANRPLAIRAIATANGKNKLAIVIPCHRVIGSNGKLVGYAGGLWRKKWLLQHEAEVLQKGQTELKF
jgi:methylated-DNA-[protein]-cysteine S-methyltransferase